MANDGISGNGGEWAHMILEWPGGRIKVAPDGTISFQGQDIPREALAEIGNVVQQWADFMASATPSVQAGSCTVGAREVLRMVLWSVTDPGTVDEIAADVAQRRAAL